MNAENLLYEGFKAKLEAVSGECYRVKTSEEAKNLIADILREKGVNSVAMVDSPLIKACNLTNSIPEGGFSLYMDNYREVTKTVNAGITEMRWAIAELGTLIQYAEDVNERLCSSFTPIHIALVQTSVLVPTIMNALKVIHQEPVIPAFVGFITGPSRTSDIERVLTIGVHGPEQLIAVFVDEEAEEAK